MKERNDKPSPLRGDFPYRGIYRKRKNRGGNDPHSQTNSVNNKMSGGGRKGSERKNSKITGRKGRGEAELFFFGKSGGL